MCSGVDVYTAMAAGVGALHGPLHGGSSEAVLDMLQAIGSTDKVPGFLQQVCLMRKFETAVRVHVLQQCTARHGLHARHSMNQQCIRSSR